MPALFRVPTLNPTKIPTQAVEVIEEHPLGLAGGLTLCCPAPGIQPNLVKATGQLTLPTGGVIGGTPVGPTFDFTNCAQAAAMPYSYALNVGGVSGKPFTLAGWFLAPSTGGTQDLICYVAPGSFTTQIELQANFFDNVFSTYFNIGTNTAEYFGIPGATTGVPTMLGGTFSKGTGISYGNGVAGGSVSVSSYTNVGTGGNIWLGGVGNVTYNMANRIWFLTMYNRALSAGDMLWLYEEPAIMLRPIVRRAWFISASAPVGTNVFIKEILASEFKASVNKLEKVELDLVSKMTKNYNLESEFLTKLGINNLLQMECLGKAAGVTRLANSEFLSNENNIKEMLGIDYVSKIQRIEYEFLDLNSKITLSEFVLDDNLLGVRKEELGFLDWMGSNVVTAYENAFIDSISKFSGLNIIEGENKSNLSKNENIGGENLLELNQKDNLYMDWGGANIVKIYENIPIEFMSFIKMNDKWGEEGLLNLKKGETFYSDILAYINVGDLTLADWTGTHLVNLIDDLPIENISSLKINDKIGYESLFEVKRNETLSKEILISVNKNNSVLSDWTGSQIVSLISDLPIENISKYVSDKIFEGESVLNFSKIEKIENESLLSNVIRDALPIGNTSSFAILNNLGGIEFKAGLKLQSIVGIDTALSHSIVIYYGAPLEILNSTNLRDLLGEEWSGFNALNLSCDMIDSPLVEVYDKLWMPSIIRMMNWNDYDNERSIQWPIKGEQDYLDYTLEFYNDNDPIISSQILNVSPNDLTIDLENLYSKKYLSFWARNGTSGNIYMITFEIVRESGKIESGNAWLPVFPLT